MKRFILIGAGLAFAAGCAQHSVPEARLGVVGATATGGSSDAVVVGTLLNAGVEYNSGHNTMVHLKGESSSTTYHDFSVIFGPHDSTYLQARTPVPQGGAAQELAPGVDPEGPEAIGKFSNPPEPSWTTEAGYALLWGWWPVGYTPTVRVVTEGRGTILVLVEKGRERIVRISGAPVKVTKGTISKTISNDMWFVDVTWDTNGNLQIDNAAPVPGGDALEETAKKALERKGKLTAP